jgi:hypothetical protein
VCKAAVTLKLISDKKTQLAQRRVSNNS